MGTVLEFPSQQAQGLAYLDKQLRQLLRSKGADDELIDFAAEQLTKTYATLTETEQYQFSVQLPPDMNEAESSHLYREIETGLQGIRAENHALMIELVAQLVLTKVQLFQHERD